MSEYWKSNPRKFCDFCKCWIADNKPSVEFHERGKRHKENVQKRLEEIGKKGKEDYENKLKENDYMKEMEEAALRAYKKDIEQNPDFTGAKIAEMAESSNAKIVIGSKSETTQKKDTKEKMIKDKKIKDKQKSPEKSQSKWHEAKSPEGFSYYWNIETEESVWEAPKEGFVSLESKEEKSKEEEEEEKKKKKKKKSSEFKKKKFIDKKKETKAPEKPVGVSSESVYGPMPIGNPYGNWESTFQPTQEVDLQLPTLPEQDYYAPELIIKKPSIKFEEKIVTLKEKSEGPISFKKRKGGEDQKKNVRRRIDD